MKSFFKSRVDGFTIIGGERDKFLKKKQAITKKSQKIHGIKILP